VTSRQLIRDDGITRLFRVLTDQGNQIGFDEETIPTLDQVNFNTLHDRATAALILNGNFLAVTAPVGPQIVAQVQMLTRECNALIRLLLDLTDTTVGT
jgi:hypothetical protein